MKATTGSQAVDCSRSTATETIALSDWRHVWTNNYARSFSCARLFSHSRNLLCMVVRAVTVQGWTNAQEKLECVTEIVAVVAIERIGAVVDGELGAETDVDAFAVRQVADVTERVAAHWKDFGFIDRLKNKFVSGFLYAFPAKVNRVAATLVIRFDQKRLRFSFFGGVVLAPDKRIRPVGIMPERDVVNRRGS